MFAYCFTNFAMGWYGTHSNLISIVCVCANGRTRQQLLSIIMNLQYSATNLIHQITFHMRNDHILHALKQLMLNLSVGWVSTWCISFLNIVLILFVGKCEARFACVRTSGSPCHFTRIQSSGSKESSLRSKWRKSVSKQTIKFGAVGAGWQRRRRIGSWSVSYSWLVKLNSKPN